MPNERQLETAILSGRIHSKWVLEGAQEQWCGFWRCQKVVR